MIGDSKRVNFIFPILILILTWPLLGGFFFVFARIWIWALVGCVAAVFLCPQYFRQKRVSFIVVFFLILLFNYITGDSYYDSFPMICLEVGVFILTSSIAYYLFEQGSQKTASFITVEIMGIISIISILTIFVNKVEPGVVRNTVEQAFSNEDYSIIYYYYRLGVTNYSLPHALPIMIPPLVMGIKNRHYSSGLRLLLLFFLVLILSLINVSGAATPVFIAFFILLVSLLTRAGTVKNNATLLVVLSLLFLPFLFFSDLSVKTLDFFAGFTSGEGTIYDRLMEIKLSIVGDAQGDLEGRFSFYLASFGEFIESIVWGSNSDPGGHSALLDRLATLGLLGFIPYIVFIWKQLKQAYIYIPDNCKVYYIEGVIAGVLMLLSKNMSNWEMWLMMFVMLPLLTIHLGEKTDS